MALNSASGKVLWRWSSEEADPRPQTLASDGERVYMQVADGVVALDLATGLPLWSYGKTVDGWRQTLTFGQYTLVVSDGVVLCNLAGNVTALAAESGSLLWTHPAGKYGFHEPLDIFVIDGLVWLGSERPDSVAPPALEDFSKGINLHTGEVENQNTIIAGLQTAGHHHRCYRERATTNYIITGKRGVELMDLNGDDHFRANWVRGSCQFGLIPANGLIYTPPHSCGCYMETKLRGFQAMASERSVLSAARRRTPDAFRPMTGHKAPDDIRSVSAEDWPTYRRSPLRDAVATTQAPAELHKVWQTAIGGALTQPVIVGGKALVASTDTHTLFALDAGSGAVAWSYTCGGRIDSPPTICQGRVLFGSADGNVYCLAIKNGAEIWRFSCAPMDMRTVAYDQIESLWPVHGSVLVLNGVAYCFAGRSTWLDGGIYFYALDPLTGTVLHERQYRSRHPAFAEHKDKGADEHLSLIHI